MFSWLQHLFTAHALQIENAALSKKVAELQAQIDKHAQVVAVKDEEIRRLENILDTAKAKRPRFAEGADDDTFGG